MMWNSKSIQFIQKYRAKKKNNERDTQKTYRKIYDIELTIIEKKNIKFKLSNSLKGRYFQMSISIEIQHIQNITKVSTSKINYIFYKMSMKISTAFSVEISKLILKFIKKCKDKYIKQS